MKRASLLQRDSVHGPFDGTIRVDEERQSLVCNGNEIKIIYGDNPEAIDYTAYGINNAIVVDNTGKWSDREGLSKHLKCPGVSKVILTAPGKGDLKNVVFGINDEQITPEDTIITAASCTTNAISPPLKVIDREFGIVNGHVETVHAYTNDQNLIDNYHKSKRRGRSAPLNMVITETGAAKAVGKVLPHLSGIAHRQRDSRTDAERVAGDSEPESEARNDRAGSQRVHAQDRAAFAAAQTDRLFEFAGSGFHRFGRLASCLHLRRRSDHRQWQHASCCTAGTTTNSVTAVRCTAAWKRWPASTTRRIRKKTDSSRHFSNISRLRAVFFIQLSPIDLRDC